MNRKTMALVLGSYELDKATGVRYNYCPYGFGGVCMKDEESQCLIYKCYHDMEVSERRSFINYWTAGKRWFNKCNHNGVFNEAE